MHLRFSSPLPALHTAATESRRRLAVCEAPVALRCGEGKGDMLFKCLPVSVCRDKPLRPPQTARIPE
ncbi:hypothetical protein VZT92_015655 [Zoarces viviparus]|uniref:Uncharacterized protein n=1 Tax=Zoarces viviparus TaxID=48416 RepID=A0AAW1F062_ZOAVI